MELHRNLKPWPPGVSGNPNGRPVGSRTVFSQGFLKDLASVWASHGRAAMEKTAIDQISEIGVHTCLCLKLVGGRGRVQGRMGPLPTVV
jgi:hypothetical protein